MKFLFTILLVIPVMIAHAQSPVKKVYAYKQETMPGIRPTEENNQNPFPAYYFLFVTVKKGTALTTERIIIDGNTYKVSVKKRKSPISHQFYDGVVSQSKVLVPRTSDDVYELVVGEKCEQPAGAEKAMSANNQVVFNLVVSKKKKLVALKTMTSLPPIMGM